MNPLKRKTCIATNSPPSIRFKKQYVPEPNFVESDNDVYVIRGLFINREYTQMIKRRMKNCTKPECLILNWAHSNSNRRFDGVMVIEKNRVMFHAVDLQSGDIELNVPYQKLDVIEFTPPLDNTWDLNNTELTNWNADELLAKFDMSKQEILLDGILPICHKQHVHNAISHLQQDDMAEEKNNAQQQQYHPSQNVMLFEDTNENVYLGHLRGQQPRLVRILPFDKDITKHFITLHTQDATILSLDCETPNSLTMMMNLSQQEDFIQRIRQRVLSKTLLTDVGCTRQTLTVKDPDTTDWLRFLSSQLPIKPLRHLKITLLHIASAWYKFEGQRLEMQNRNLESVPRLMYHGVRAKNQVQVVEEIKTSGFNAKYAQSSFYGEGGIYCSPQAPCALSYVKYPPGTSFLQNTMFVCLTLPGKIGYNGTKNQKMAPDQNSWYALSGCSQIFCIESNAILPIAALTFD